MNLKKLIKDELGDFKRDSINESEFDWTDSVYPDAMHVGSFVYLDGYSDGDEYNGEWKPGQYIVLEIVDVDEAGEVKYITRYTNVPVEMNTIGVIDSIPYDLARDLIDTYYWRPWDGKKGLNDVEESSINESEFDWMYDAPSYDINVGDEYTIPSMGKKDVRVRVDEPYGISMFRLTLIDSEGGGSTSMPKKDIIDKLRRGFWVKEVITESEFDWATDVPSWDNRYGDDFFVGSKWTHVGDNHSIIYTITKIEGDIITFRWVYRNGMANGMYYSSTQPISYFDNESVRIKFHNIKESFKR